MSNAALFTHLHRALQLHQTGQLAEARQLYHDVLTRDPNCAEAWHLLGVLAQQTGEGDAPALIQRALALRPNFPEALGNLGVWHQQRSEFEAAISCHRRALAIQPHSPQTLFHLAHALSAAGRKEEAAAALRTAITQAPEWFTAYHDYGCLLDDLGRSAEAIAAFQRAIALRPDSANIHCNLGNAFAHQRAFADALASYTEAARLDPSLVEAHNGRGHMLGLLGDIVGAVDAYRRAIQLRPANAAFHSNLLYTLVFDPRQDAASLHTEHARWNASHATPAPLPAGRHANDRRPGRRLRVGYVSPDFRDHAESFFVVPLLEAHDHERFEIHAYASIARPDAVTARCRRAVDQWHDVLALDHGALAEKIRADQIDVLVDLTMHMADNRLPMFARRPAPVQVTWLAYPATTGLPAIDYRLSDSHIDPVPDPFSAEQIVRLSDSWCCYDPLIADSVPDEAPSRLGGRFTFGSLNNFIKTGDAVLGTWSEILARVPDSGLLLLCPDGPARHRVREVLGRRGVAIERVSFVGYQPRPDYLATYRHIDLALDPEPYNGITTTLDALWMGVPVLTRPGRLGPARAGLSLLTTLGLDDFVASSPANYVDRAVKIAAAPLELTKLRHELRSRLRRSPLMDAPRFARNVEAAYHSMWATWCESTPT